jgi:hypothetical protein
MAMDKMMNFFNFNQLFADSISVSVVLGHSIRSQKDPRKCLKLQFNPNDLISVIIDHVIANYDINLPYGVKKDDTAMYGLYLASTPPSNGANTTTASNPSDHTNSSGPTEEATSLQSSDGSTTGFMQGLSLISSYSSSSTSSSSHPDAKQGTKAPRPATKESDSDAEEKAEREGSSTPNPSPVVMNAEQHAMPIANSSHPLPSSVASSSPPTASFIASQPSSSTTASPSEESKMIFLNDREWLDVTKTFKEHSFTSGVWQF